MAMVEFLAPKVQAAPHLKNKKGSTALDLAIIRQDKKGAEILKYLINLGGGYEKLKDPERQGKDMFQHAISLGNTDVVRALLETGADPVEEKAAPFQGPDSGPKAGARFRPH